MQQRYALSPNEMKQLTTEQVRDHFLLQNLLQDNVVQFTYTHYDRMMIGGAKPTTTPAVLETFPELRSEYFLERREIGIINVGGDGMVDVDGTSFPISKLDCLYVGKGAQQVTFASSNAVNPPLLYLLSTPAHEILPTRLMKKEEASPTELGTLATANQRTIYKYIHLQGIQSSQLVMGLTVLKEGSVWNTMPAHVHDRRMEAYFYFDVPEGQRVVHFMGHPQETRHMFVANHQAIISPPWSIHSGCGTSNYAFIWGMAGENKDYTDMDAVTIPDLR
ncbi:MAG: 5-dehydro-4-deoxy-D-glucuronate isomerase [Chitinophagaceae bacterium]